MNCIKCGVSIESPAFCSRCSKDERAEHNGSELMPQFESLMSAERALSTSRNTQTLRLVARWAHESGYKRWIQESLPKETVESIFCHVSAVEPGAEISVLVRRHIRDVHLIASALDSFKFETGMMYKFRWNAWNDLKESLFSDYPFYTLDDVMMKWKEEIYPPAFSTGCYHFDQGVYTSVVSINRGVCYCGQFISYKGEVYNTHEYFDGAVKDGRQKMAAFGQRYKFPANITNLTKVCQADQPFHVKIEAFVEGHRIVRNMEEIAKGFKYRMSTRSIEGMPLHQEVIERIVDTDMFGFHTESVSVILNEWLAHANGYRPFSQQIIMAEITYHARYVAWWVDMRVGKTLSAMMLMHRTLQEKKVDCWFVIAPAMNLYDPWVSELEKQNWFKVAVLDQGEKQACIDLEDDSVDIYVISYSSLSARLKQIFHYKDTTNIGWIGDETSMIKNFSASRTRRAIQATRNAKYVVALNGTPIANGPQDVFPQQMFIDQGTAFGISEAEFDKDWIETTRAGKKVVSRGKRMNFELRLASTAYRCLRGEADQFRGKDKNYRFISCSATKEMQVAYNEIMAGFTRDEEGEARSVKSNILTVFGHLRECCAGYTKYEVVENSGDYIRARFKVNAKVLWVRTMLKSNPGQPFVIFSESSELEDWLQEMLIEEGIPFSCVRKHGSKSTKGNAEKAEAVRQFQEGEVRVILLKSIQGKGITLNRIPAVKEGLGSYPAMIYTQPTWSLVDWEQSNDRCVGVDQVTNRSISTMIYVLSIAGSIEDKIIRALRDKKSVAEKLLEDAGRNGYENPFKGMDLTTSSRLDEDFDVEEMEARYRLGIGPHQKLSESMVTKHDLRYRAKTKCVTQKSISGEDMSEYGEYLMGKIK